ncbi:MAG: hypothetical protein VKP62_10600 [Candidatus Sericytochromatia bacterium]|nr:hypothetical protein [Candidatus Sericytochromatia bacterium]
MGDLRLAYFKTMAWASGAYAGGLMVVDENGLPLDFRYTDPVQPTRLQEVLYGKSLDRHMRQEVLFKHLTARIDPRPNWLFVDDDQLLHLTACAPVVSLAETRLPPLREAALCQVLSETEWLLQAGETGSPLKFRAYKPESGAIESLVDTLVLVADCGLDPVEPFNRVRQALEIACAPSSAPA